jgi:hypothetical protein
VAVAPYLPFATKCNNLMFTRDVQGVPAAETAPPSNSDS